MGRKRVSNYLVPAERSQEENILRMCKMLDLNGIAISFKSVIENINEQKGTLYDFCENLFEKEVTYKEENRLNRWTQYAHFPFRKTIQEFDFSFQPSVDQKIINELLSGRYINEGKNIIFLGPPGVGKTHLSVGLGLEAIHQGRETKFITLNNFISEVEKAKDAHTSARLFKNLMSPEVLIIDDIDFYETGENASTVLFKLVCQRHQANLPSIFTSNKPFNEWGKLFGDEKRAAAALDRIVGNAIIVNISGVSYRMKEKIKKVNQPVI